MWHADGFLRRRRDDETGFAEPPENVEEFAQRLTTRLNDDPWRARIGRCCREIAPAEYSMEPRAKRDLQLFDKIYTPLWLEPVRAN
jgi:glycosyltransferase involved in cell wall biosynthesis